MNPRVDLSAVRFVSVEGELVRVPCEAQQAEREEIDTSNFTAPDVFAKSGGKIDDDALKESFCK